MCSTLLELLLESGGDLAAGEGEEAGPLLHAAASVGCLDCLRLLTRREASKEAQVRLWVPGDGQTLVHR